MWAEMWYSGKQRTKQWKVTHIITIMNYNGHWNIMTEQIMLCSCQKSEKRKKVLFPKYCIKYKARKGAGEGSSNDENLYI